MADEPGGPDEHRARRAVARRALRRACVRKSSRFPSFARSRFAWRPVLGLVGETHRASPIRRRRARAAPFMTAYPVQEAYPEQCATFALPRRAG